MNQSLTRILLADDEPSITHLLKLNLEADRDFIVMPHDAAKGNLRHRIRA